YFEDPAGFVAVVVESSDAFDDKTLAYVTELTRALQPSPLFSHVRSVVNARATRWARDSVDVGLLLPDIPKTPVERDRLRAIVHDSILLRRVLVSDDAKATLIAAQLAVPPTSSSLEDLRIAVAAVHDV